MGGRDRGTWGRSHHALGGRDRGTRARGDKDMGEVIQVPPRGPPWSWREVLDPGRRCSCERRAMQLVAWRSALPIARAGSAICRARPMVSRGGSGRGGAEGRAIAVERQAVRVSLGVLVSGRARSADCRTRTRGGRTRLTSARSDGESRRRVAMASGDGEWRWRTAMARTDGEDRRAGRRAPRAPQRVRR